MLEFRAFFMFSESWHVSCNRNKRLWQKETEVAEQYGNAL